MDEDFLNLLVDNVQRSLLLGEIMEPYMYELSINAMLSGYSKMELTKLQIKAGMIFTKRLLESGKID